MTRAHAVSLALAGAVVLLAAISLSLGPAPLPMGEAMAGLFDKEPSAAALILREIRLPRALLAVLVGATLGLAGAVLQGLLRNPLAEPGVTGISGMATLGAVVAFYFGLAQIIPYAVPAAGIIGAFVGAWLLHRLGGPAGDVASLILAGVALASFAGAATALALNLAPSPYAVVEIVFWLLGSVTDRTLPDVLLAAPPMLLGWVLLAGTGRALDALSLGNDVARSLGHDLARTRNQVIAGTALSVGAAVSVSGSIGFVGLMVPHLLRPLVGAEPGRLLLPSALGGAALLALADIVTRLLPPDREVKLGVMTALIGAPFFLMLALRHVRTAA
jgi:iron complex transport system permease protein